MEEVAGRSKSIVTQLKSKLKKQWYDSPLWIQEYLTEWSRQNKQNIGQAFLTLQGLNKALEVKDNDEDSAAS